MELYIQTDLNLDELAKVVATAINVAPSNRTSYQKEQRRESVNRGGTYFLFEILGFELLLLQNAGETLVTERSDWPFYLLVDGEDVTAETARSICKHLKVLMAREGFQAEVDDLAA